MNMASILKKYSNSIDVRIKPRRFIKTGQRGYSWAGGALGKHEPALNGSVALPILGDLIRRHPRALHLLLKPMLTREKL